MNDDVELVDRQLLGWRARVGNDFFYGTRGQCLNWLVAKQEKLIEQAQDIHAIIVAEQFDDAPCHGERRSS